MTPPGKRACYVSLVGFILVSCAFPGRPQPTPVAPHPFLPRPGTQAVKILTSTTLEVDSLESWPVGPIPEVNPAPSMRVSLDGQPQNFTRRGCRRRVLDMPPAPAGQPATALLQTSWIVQLQQPLRERQRVEVALAEAAPCVAVFAEHRSSPVVRVNLGGYRPGSPKRFWLSYYLGDAGYLQTRAGRFQLLRAADHKLVFAGSLSPGQDRGWPWPSPHANLEVGNFSDFNLPGRYVLFVPGLGESEEFRVGSEAPLDWTRTLALGLYHQRCGTANQLPFTRFGHRPCHTRTALIPSPTEQPYAKMLCQTSGLAEADQVYFPSIQQGRVDVQGGHHDAGDYSKYLINSARLIHALMLAVDYFPGVAQLDQLGLPESGDGHSDLLQEALLEADFVSRMQDRDGGFYFMVYPRTRRYEDNVLPDQGDEQVVYPKATTSTAAGSAALAQCARSPRLRAFDPERARRYRRQAERGWDFLEQAWKVHGEAGAYQKITHYGERFQDRDEIVWAASELYLLTGEERYSRFLLSHFQPQSPATRHWGWLRLCESYGCALRHLALADQAGEPAMARLPAPFRAQVRAEVLGWANDLIEASQGCAYGLALPFASKRAVRTGWFFPTDQAFDLLVADLVQPSPEQSQALWSQIDYTLGCNPNSLCYLTGLARYPLEVVSQYARNSPCRLPPIGLLVSCVQEGFPRRDNLGAMSWPPDNQQPSGYPLLQRWGDCFNPATEATVENQAKALALLAAFTPAGSAPAEAALQLIRSTQGEWSVAAPVPAGHFVWEAPGQISTQATFTDHGKKPPWLQLQVHFEDGRRAFGVWP